MTEMKSVEATNDNTANSMLEDPIDRIPELYMEMDAKSKYALANAVGLLFT